MLQLRRDPIVGRWVIVNIEEQADLEEFKVPRPPSKEKRNKCPFCPGNEQMTPPEIEADRKKGTVPNSVGWSVRVVSNKFPALRIEGNLERIGVGMFDMSTGVGAHEVIIETPSHEQSSADLSNSQMEKVIKAYRSRAKDLKKDKRFKYILIFKNHGLPAGASLEHCHSQLIALPMVPKNVSEELRGSHFYFEYKQRCIYCDMLRQERRDKVRLVEENSHFVCFCPFASRFPFEAWVVPKRHHSNFNFIEDDEIPDLASILRDALTKMKILLSDPSYNFIIHTSPLEEADREDYHWHIEIMPRLRRIAGFEWGTGFYINPISPEMVAKYLRA